MSGPYKLGLYPTINQPAVLRKYDQAVGASEQGTMSQVCDYADSKVEVQPHYEASGPGYAVAAQPVDKFTRRLSYR